VTFQETLLYSEIQDSLLDHVVSGHQQSLSSDLGTLSDRLIALYCTVTYRVVLYPMRVFWLQVRVAEEGVNATVGGSTESVREYCNAVAGTAVSTAAATAAALPTTTATTTTVATLTPGGTAATTSNYICWYDIFTTTTATPTTDAPQGGQISRRLRLISRQAPAVSTPL
jgi:hypothetical protein